jgi:LysM repeat protein
VDTRVLLGHKCALNTCMLVLVGLVALCSACAAETDAAPGSEQEQADALAMAGNQLAPAVQEGSTILRFEPAPQYVKVDGVIAVQLRLENVQNLYGLEAHLTFDKNIVQIEDDDAGQDGVQIAKGQFPYPDFSVQNMVDNFGGRLDYAVVQLAPRAPASGSGVVATIRFRGVSKGSSSINFTGAKLASPDGFAIPVTLQEGAIVVGDVTGPTPPPATITPPAATATSVPPETAVPGDNTPTPLPTPSPQATLTPPVTACPTLYVVRSGDTAFAVALRFGISLEALSAANSLSDSYRINIGQLLIIPGVPGPVGELHLVQAGETLYSIAGQHNVSVETAAAINGIPHPWHVRLGQTLLICPP